MKYTNVLFSNIDGSQMSYVGRTESNIDYWLKWEPPRNSKYIYYCFATNGSRHLTHSTKKKQIFWEVKLLYILAARESYNNIFVQIQGNNIYYTKGYIIKD